MHGIPQQQMQHSASDASLQWCCDLHASLAHMTTSCGAFNDGSDGGKHSACLMLTMRGTLEVVDMITCNVLASINRGTLVCPCKSSKPYTLCSDHTAGVL